MSKTKSNVNPGQYKVAGRERQGEDVIHDRQRAKLTQSRARLEHHAPNPERPAPIEERLMPEQETLERARRDEGEGKSLKSTRTKAARDLAKARRQPRRKPSPTRSRGVRKALKREGRSAATASALARQARTSARRRTASQRSAAARKALRARARGR